MLGLLGVYLKLALLAPQWGAVARFLGKEPGQPLGWLDRLGFFADDLALNLLIVPLVATAADRPRLRRPGVSPSPAPASPCSAWPISSSCGPAREVGQYISGEMLRDFIGWSATHPSSASDYLTPASVIKLAALLAALGGLLLAARGARRSAARRRRQALTALLVAPAVVDRGRRRRPDARSPTPSACRSRR